MEGGTTIRLMDLPVEMLDKILSYLSYDQIAKVRQVNRTFNSICSGKLNNGFTALEKFHSKCMKAVKSKLPRRESERKHHPLARHCDILMAVETRFSMLSMTFTKYIEMRQCCFIPGKVLDEAFRVLRIVNNSSSPSPRNLQYPNLPRPYEFLQEYRDISSMAMEHFDDKILPIIREKMQLENPPLYYYKSKLSRPQLLSMRAVKTNIQSNNVVATCTKNSSQQIPDDSHLYKMFHPAVKLVKDLHNTFVKCNSARKAIGVVHRKIIMESNKLRIENVLLKRKCNQLSTESKLMRKELVESKSAMDKLRTQLKSQPSSSAVSPRENVTNSEKKLYKLLRNTNVKCNSTHKTVASLNRNMKIMSRRMRVQESLLRNMLSEKNHSNQESNNSCIVPSVKVNQLLNHLSCSKDVKRRRLMTVEENQNIN